MLKRPNNTIIVPVMAWVIESVDVGNELLKLLERYKIC